MKRDGKFRRLNVIAPVEDENLGAASDLRARRMENAIRVGRGQGELHRQSEAVAGIPSCDINRIFGGRISVMPPGLLLDRLHGGRGRMARHCASVTETEVDVTMSVDVVKVRGLGLADERRERSGTFTISSWAHRRAETSCRSKKSFRFGRSLTKRFLLRVA